MGLAQQRLVDVVARLRRVRPEALDVALRRVELRVTDPRSQDYEDPVVLPRRACTVEDFCNRLHKGIIKSFKQALVWGLSVKHRPQRVGKDHVLEDEDVVQIIKKV